MATRGLRQRRGIDVFFMPHGGDEDLYDCSVGVVTRGSDSHCNSGSHTSRVEDSATHHTSKSRALSRGVLAGLLVFAARAEALTPFVEVGRTVFSAVTTGNPPL
jgi:hypothetical protein